MPTFEVIGSQELLLAMLFSVAALAATPFIVASKEALPRLFWLIAFVLVLARLDDLQPISTICRGAVGPCALAIAFATVAKERNAGPSIWSIGNLLIAIYLVIAVFMVEDWQYAVGMRIQWVAICLAALAVDFTKLSNRECVSLLRFFSAGATGGCLVALTALIFDPVTACQNGFGRFMPYDANPNFVGTVFAFTSASSFYRATHNEKRPWLVSLVSAAVFLVATLSTLSRGAWVFFFVATAPLWIRALAKTRWLVVLFPTLIAVTVAAVSFSDAFDTSRLETTIQGRTDSLFYTEVEQRLAFGLLGVHRALAYDPHLHAHNAYLSFLYFGGVVAALPFLMLYLIKAVGSACNLLPNSAVYHYPMVAFTSATACACFIHGFINESICHPTHLIAVFPLLIPISLGINRVGTRLAANSSVSRLPSWSRI